MKSLRVIIVIFGEEQWLDIAQAIHTIEMIPKSMILIIYMKESYFYSLFVINVNSSNFFYKSIVILEYI